MDRRNFILKSNALSSLLFFPSLNSKAKEATFFHLAKVQDRWLLRDPKGKPFYSLGMNHISNAVLKHPENVHIWYEKYDNSQKKWLKSVNKNLNKWGFNTIGWVADVVTKRKDSHKHSRGFTYEEYQWLDMPYCHRLPFAEIHHYESDVKNPDFFSEGFKDWCDYVAREYCSQFAKDPKLIGYFYSDCPAWIHTRKEANWKDPLFDPELLDTEAGKKELFNLATQYYKICHESIRRYDPHHLILGDRFEVKRPWTEIVFKAAKPYINVFSFQFFGTADELVRGLNNFAAITEKPVLLADFGVPDYNTRENGYFSQNWQQYQKILQNILQAKHCIGAHFCGAYIRNRQRKYGILNEKDEANVKEIALLEKENTLLLESFRKHLKD